MINYGSVISMFLDNTQTQQLDAVPADFFYVGSDFIMTANETSKPLTHIEQIPSA
jgi:hypothetical protein